MITVTGQCYTMKGLLFLVLLSLLAVTSYAAPERRGMCLTFCSQYGTKCPDGYECRGNGCGQQCYRPADYIQPAGCVAQNCTTECPVGYEMTSRGCDTCRCDYSVMKLG
ncbi:cysteine-rich motor neuron 1 protein-like [Argopecten irradians]|uniref:cysteine-rich motor neuron 1 protein-like n=1 Tax=Argopecten irradians TaxID=31199 RepID=UPI00370FC8DF